MLSDRIQASFFEQRSKSFVTPQQFLAALSAHRFSKADFQNQSTMLSFGRLGTKYHGKTLLLLALEWNQLDVASALLWYDDKNIALNLADQHPAGKNTPLLLAAKVNATDMAIQLIERGANPNAQDARGDTALHYACLYRNDFLITCLLAKGANPLISNYHNHLAKKYYEKEIKPIMLEYAYGRSGKYLFWSKEINTKYAATRVDYLSNLRWYIMHVIANQDIGHDTHFHMQGKNLSLNAWAKKHLASRHHLIRGELYDMMMACFCKHRRTLDTEILKKLQEPNQPQIMQIKTGPQPCRIV